ncbi:MAG TPA: dihydrofolate reductase family protein [Pyrinomonadaceae bacterium]|nr:dihydrofolate reductase family protein [Pyrinomonadaceae bacterium]
MRKVTFGCANSLDNYIAREDGSFDWIMHSEEANQVMRDFWPRIDTMIMGRKTWEISQQYMKKSDKKKLPHGDLETYVFSRTLKPGEREGVTFLSDDPGQFVRELKQKEGKEIVIMSGGSLAKPLLEAGVVDEIGFNIHPVLLGSGAPLFYPMSRQIDLELIECRQFKNGCVYVLYRVRN